MQVGLTLLIHSTLPKSYVLSRLGLPGWRRYLQPDQTVIVRLMHAGLILQGSNPAYWEIGLLHAEGRFTGLLVLTPVNARSTPKSPSNLRGSKAPL